MKKIHKRLTALLPYLLILLILAGGLGGSFLLIRYAPVYDASIVRHDAPLEDRLLFADAKEPLLLYPWDRIIPQYARPYAEFLSDKVHSYLSGVFNKTVKEYLRLFSSVEAADDVFFNAAMFSEQYYLDVDGNFVYIKDLVFRSVDNSEYVLNIVLRQDDYAVVYYHCVPKDRPQISDEILTEGYEFVLSFFDGSNVILSDVFYLDPYYKYHFDFNPPETVSDVHSYNFLCALLAFSQGLPEERLERFAAFMSQGIDAVSVNIVAYENELLLFFSNYQADYYGDNVTLGYAVCQADLRKGDERGGVLETGDMAQVDADGYYTIVGRKKRFLKLYGNRVNLDELEQLLKAAFPGVDVACGGADDPRPIKMRQRGSDGKWFLWEQYLLTGVRTPKAADPWA